MDSAHKSKSGLARIGRALGYSLQGFAAAWRNEHAFRQELMLCLMLLPFALFLPLQILERVMLITTLFIVLVVELLNSAIEAVVDRVSLDNHDLSKRAKDLGSAAVFLSLAIAGMTWVLIAGPAIVRLF
jgi:diacylglycerol kinase (ATP)